MWRASLRTRLMLMVILAIVPALLLALSMGLRQRAMVVDHATEIAARLADGASGDQRRLVESTRQLLIALSSHPTVMGADPDACNTLLAYLLAGDPRYTNLAVVAPNGQMICSGMPLDGTVNVGDRRYFQQALATEQFALAEYVIGRVSGKATLLTGLPVLDDAGEPRAVLHAGIDLTWINRFAQEVHLPPGGEITVIRRDGVVLVQHPDPDTWVGKAIPSDGPLAASIRAGEDAGSGRFTDDGGTDRLYAFTPLGNREAGGADAVIAVSIPTASALAGADAVLWENVLTLSLVALLALAAAWFGGEAFLVRRVRGLVAASERLAGGDFGARADANGGSGELGRLAQAFNRMAESLQRRVLEREDATRALSASETRYRSVIDNVKEVIFQTDAAGHWVFLNPAWADVTGFAVAESLGRPFLDYVHPFDRERGQAVFAPLIRRETTECRHEIRCRHADGGFRWVDLYARVVVDGDTVVGVFGTLMDVTERRRATTALLHQERLLRGVAAATNHLLVSSELDSAVAVALATLGEAAGVDRVVIFENHRDPASDAVYPGVRFAWSGDLAPPWSLAEHDPNGSPAGPPPFWYQALREGRPVGGLTRELPEPERELLERAGIRSLLVVPITIQGQFWGAIAFDDCTRERVWTDAEVSILGAMAGSIGGAIARQQGEEAVRLAQRAAERESERLLALHRAATALGSATVDPSEVVEDILQSAAGLLGADDASLYTWDTDAQILRSVRGFGIPHDDAPPDRLVGQGLAGQTFLRNAPVIVNDYQRWEHAQPNDRADGLQAGIGVPLRHGGRSTGVLLVRSYQPGSRPFGDDDARVVELFADQAAAALENARLITSMERRLERLRALAHLAQTISSSLDMTAVLREIVRSAARLSGAPVASFWVLDEAAGELHVTAHSERGLDADRPPGVKRVGEGAVGWVAQARRALDVPDVFVDPRFERLDWLRSHDLRSFYGIPVIHEDRLLGVLTLNGTVPFSFGPEDRDLLEIFVAQIATAFRNASLFEEVARSNQALEASVRRANELAEVARAADRAKSEFLSRMSHELRTPMNAILGFAQIVELQDRERKHAECVGHILKAGHHLLALINEVLDISRIESGKLQLSVEPVDAASVASEVFDLIRPLADERQVRLAAPDAHPAIGWVMADRQRLKQILVNLMTNAVKYNRPGGDVVVTIEARAQGAGATERGARPAADRVRIAVRDSGVGIEPAKLNRLFDPFDRLDAETSGIEGTGLGLTISRSLAEAMSGTLTVESTPGGGSTFWLTLPPAQAPANALPEPETVEPVGAAAALPTRHMVLYIEDNPPNRLLIERVFEWRPDVELVTAMDGTTGLALARSRPPSLVLLDIHLPDISGPDVLEALARDPRTASVPVVILSADASPGQIQRLLNAGAHSYLTKPIVVRELLKTVDTILEAA